MEPLLIVALVVVLFAVARAGEGGADRAAGPGPQRRAARPLPPHAAAPGSTSSIPFVDRVYPAIDLREQVVSFAPQPVITEDNLVVEIDTVLYFQVTDPRSAAYEIASYLQAVEQLTVTTLRNVVGSMDLEKTLTSRDEINSRLRGVLDEATGKWGLRVNRVEIKAIDPPKSIKDAMEKQMRAERDKRAAILTAEGARAVPDPHRRGRQAGRHPARRGRAVGGDPAGGGRGAGHRPGLQRGAPQRPRPEAAGLPVPADAAAARPGEGNTFWVIPSEVTSALSGIAQAFGSAGAAAPPAGSRVRAPHVGTRRRGPDRRGGRERERANRPSRPLRRGLRSRPALLSRAVVGSTRRAPRLSPGVSGGAPVRHAPRRPTSRTTPSGGMAHAACAGSAQVSHSATATAP